jgi:peptidylamidoglycolate lyase
MRYLLFILLVSITLSCNNNNKPAGLTAEKPGYELVKEWPHLPPGYKLSQVTGVGVDTDQNIFLFHRTGRQWSEPFPDSTISVATILMLDRNTGQILNSWGAEHFIMPHGLTVDQNNNIWVTDVGLHQVFKFSHEGKLLMTLGQAKIPGTDSAHFNLPTDVAVKSNGSFYVSDGYGNSRVIKFSADGRYLFSWGTKGNEPGQFNTPHGVDLDKEGNVYVADRENNRIQIFDSTGKFIALWKNTVAEQLYSVTINKLNQEVFAVDYLTRLTLPVGSDILRLDTAFVLRERFGRSGTYDGPKARYHDIALDNEGSIYLADILSPNIYKFKKLK